MENVPEKRDDVGLIRISEVLFKSGMFPLVKNAAGAFCITQYGAELGIGPMTSLQCISIVQGRLCMSAAMMLSLGIKSGVQYAILKHTNEECQIKFSRGSTEFVSSFSIADAKQAGIYRDQSGWTKYPQDMLFWRAVTRGLRRVAPDVILGLYAKEELEEAAPLNGSVTVEPEPAKEEPTKTETKTSFAFLQAMGKAKKALGDKYYDILYQYEYQHADEVKEGDRDNILYEMREAYKALKEDKDA